MPRTRNIYSPTSDKPFAISRSKLDRFLECSRCFYLDRRLGIDRPSIPGYTLNQAVDTLLKKEFDYYRERQEPHPFMVTNNVDAIPYSDPRLDEWRENFKGIRVHHSATNFIVFGALDDVWINQHGQLNVVDYKATSTSEEITLDSEYRQGYKRQLEIYQWLLKQTGLKVSNTAYILYANAQKTESEFGGKLQFGMQLLKHIGDNDWVEPIVYAAYECLQDENIPDPSSVCKYCEYRIAAAKYDN